MKIYFLNGDKAGQTLELTPPGISIGRETDNDVQLLVGGVSRYHAKIEFANDAWMLRDLGSTNGTKVNGTTAPAPRALQPGDIIMMGDQSIRFGERISTVVSPVSPAAPTPPPSAPAQPPAEPSVPTIQEIPLPPPSSPQPQFIFNAPSPQPPQQQPAPSPAASTPQADKEAHAKSFFDSFKSSAASQSAARIEGDIFSKPKEQQNPAQRKSVFGGKIGNLVFYVAVVGAAVIFISIFIMMQQEPKKKNGAQQNAARTEAPQPFLLIYEKQRTTKDNIFKFTLNVEDGSAIFSLDDLKHNRHFYKSFGKANETFLRDLENSVKKTDFMKLEQDAPGVSDDGTDEVRTLIVGHGNNLKKIAVRNTYAKSSFEEIERAIDKFAEDYQLKTVSITVEEMKSEAEKAFLRAESLFDNYLASPENLREAIIRYQLTLDYLDQFEPKPKEWDLARKRLQEAQTLLDKQVKELEFSVTQLYKLKQYKKASEECQKLMDMVDPNSTQYKKARDYKLTFDKLARSAERR